MRACHMCPTGTWENRVPRSPASRGTSGLGRGTGGAEAEGLGSLGEGEGVWACRHARGTLLTPPLVFVQRCPHPTPRAIVIPSVLRRLPPACQPCHHPLTPSPSIAESQGLWTPLVRVSCQRPPGLPAPVPAFQEGPSGLNMVLTTLQRPHKSWPV